MHAHLDHRVGERRRVARQHGNTAKPSINASGTWRGVALAYVKLKPFATAEQRNVIEPWLQRFADAARAFFDDRERARNNHWYWLGLAAAAVGHATDSPRHWEMARDIMRDAARDIGTDGILQKECGAQIAGASLPRIRTHPIDRHGGDCCGPRRRLVRS